MDAKLHVDFIDSRPQIEALTGLFDKMWSSRNLPNHYQDSSEKLWAVLTLLKEKDQGRIMAIYNENNVMIGATIMLFEGERLYHDSGASSPEHRQIPIMHLLIHEMVRFGKNNGFGLLDLGGYDLLATDKDQTKHINQFKSGFRGNILVFPKQMNFVLNPLVYALFRSALWLRGRLS